MYKKTETARAEPDRTNLLRIKKIILHYFALTRLSLMMFQSMFNIKQQYYFLKTWG